MTNKEKSLLLKDLCARLPYGVKVQYTSKLGETIVKELRGSDIEVLYDGYHPERYKPYIRPMSSMTEEEHKEMRNKFGDCSAVEPGVGSSPWYNHPERDLKNVQFFFRRVPDIVDWLNQHHFDYRGLIKKELALEAPEGMYNTKQ